jgi:hypothetical protein
MSNRDQQWRKWCDDNVGVTRNEDLLYQCWKAAWDESQNDISETLDRLLQGSTQIMEVQKNEHKESR